MPRKERERRYIAEYMLQTFPEGDYQLNVELGEIPEEYVTRYGQTRAAALFRPTRPRVDAVKWTDDKYIIIEAKLRDIKTGIGDLMYYQIQVKKTVDLPFYNDQPITYRLVIPWMLDWIRGAARDAKVEVDIFYPAWVEEYVRERQHYFTSAYRDARREKMQLRRALDLE